MMVKDVVEGIRTVRGPRRFVVEVLGALVVALLAVGLAFVAALAIMPQWVLVVVVFLCALIIATQFMKGGG